MAKIKSSGLIQSISGKVGDLVFVRHRGTLTVRKKPKSTNPRTELQIKVRQSLGTLIKRYFNLSFYDRVLWEEHGHNIPFSDNLYSGLIRRPSGKLRGQDAYISVNQVLASCGFPPIDKPPHPSTPRPSSLCTDLSHYSQHRQGEARFKAWIPSEHPYKCMAQIWAQARKGSSHPYIAQVIEISTTPREVVLTKIKVRKDKKNMELPLKEMKKIEFKMQLRAVSEKGVFSIPTCMYILEVVSD
ncbi:MAG: hypothetical protein HY769_00935 [Candidatus Stahlbacteria bacterium]|nr:hypothetical protein [Candidatus Stahlbacteria bacterium]